MCAIKTAKRKGIVCVAVSQCLTGGVSLDTYSLGRDFQQNGVVSGGDMTTEACSTKLAYLFARLKEPELVAKAISESIRGEMTTSVADKSHYFAPRELLASKL
jgi:L-asparaginase/Glu-tRNA(Gln) amidotransferase subunit D